MVSKQIGEMVYDTIVNYTKLQNKTKLLYFNYLSKGKSVNDFNEVADKLWSNIDHKFMDKQINKLQEAIHNEDVKIAARYEKKEEQDLIVKDKNKTYYKLVPESEFNKVEKKFKDRVVYSYDKAMKTAKNVDLDMYLEKKLDSYDNEVNKAIAYYGKHNEVVRHVDVSTYLSMLHNTNLTRSAWNQTLIDADRLNAEYFFIPTHPFSCPECAMWQGKPLDKETVENEFGEAEEQVGDLLHPNCKCTLSILWDTQQLNASKEYQKEYTSEELEEQYNVRQKVNSITLMKSRIRNDINIAKMLGNDGLVDKLQKRNKTLNEREKKLVNSLPTTSLKKQVEAINR